MGLRLRDGFAASGWVAKPPEGGPSAKITDTRPQNDTGRRVCVKFVEGLRISTVSYLVLGYIIILQYPPPRLGATAFLDLCCYFVALELCYFVTS